MVRRMHGLEAAILGVCGDRDTPFDAGLPANVGSILPAWMAPSERLQHRARQRRVYRVGAHGGRIAGNLEGVWDD
jgi:hypothetical protein